MMDGGMLPIRRWLIARLGGLYNDLIGRRAHLGAAAVIFDGNGRVLLVRHSYGQRGWELPGGGRQPKESLQQAGPPEIREELGGGAGPGGLPAGSFQPEIGPAHLAVLWRPAGRSPPGRSSPPQLRRPPGLHRPYRRL